MTKIVGIVAATVVSTLVGVWALSGGSPYPTGSYSLAPTESDSIESLEGWVKFLPVRKPGIEAVNVAYSIDIELDAEHLEKRRVPWAKHSPEPPDEYPVYFMIRLLDCDGFQLMSFQTTVHRAAAVGQTNIKHVGQAISVEQAELVTSATIEPVVEVMDLNLTDFSRAASAFSQ